jgi:prevent-host-death family protein
MKTVPVTEFKARCLSLLEDVARTGHPLLVTKHGKPLARVMPTGGAKAQRPQDTLFESVEIIGDVIASVRPARAWNAARGVLVKRNARAKSPRKSVR